MDRIINHLGQIRLYSLVDLWLLLVVVTDDHLKIAGGLMLHIAFLLLLEGMHRDRGRIAFPRLCFPTTLLFVTIMYGNLPWATAYMIISWIYSRKKSRPFGLLSPLMRGIQTWILVGGLTNHGSQLAIIAGLVMLVRNLIGDIRDTNKDRTEGVRTIPVAIALTGQYPHTHQFAVHATTLIWWLLSQGGISFWWVIVCWVVQATTYRLTPR